MYWFHFLQNTEQNDNKDNSNKDNEKKALDNNSNNKAKDNEDEDNNKLTRLGRYDRTKLNCKELNC